MDNAFAALDDEIDRLFWLPTRINELTHSGIQNVASKMVSCLPALQQARIHQVIETALIKELETLTENELEMFKRQTDCLSEQKFIVLVEVKNKHGKRINDGWAFTSLENAQRVIYQYSGDPLEKCAKFVTTLNTDIHLKDATYINTRILKVDSKELLFPKKSE